MDAYLDELRSCRFLTRQEEHKLAMLAQGGDREAREILVRSILPYGVRLAQRFIGCGVPLEDLVQEANLGILRAVSKFNPRRGTRLSTYAHCWIRQFLFRAVRCYGVVRRPMGRDVDFRVESLDQGLPGSRESLPRVDLMPDERVDERPDLDAQDELARLWQALAILPERSSQVIRLRLSGCTLDQVAVTIGVTRERARQIEAAAIRRLAVLLGADPDAVTSFTAAMRRT